MPVQSLKRLEVKLDRPGTSLIAGVQVSKVSEKCARPLPPNLLAVQRAASRELKLSAKRVEEILERLYLQRTITYPRTETTVYPKWFDTEEQYRCLNIAAAADEGLHFDTEASKIASHARRLLDGSFNAPRTDGWDAGDHEPIRPLSMARKPVPFEVRLESDDEIIALQSALSEDWEIQTDVHVGERVLRRGWTVTLPNKKRLQHTKSVWDLQAAGRASGRAWIRRLTIALRPSKPANGG